MEQTITLSRLNEFIQRVIGLNFEESFWVSCEVIQAKEIRGHFYIELSEKGNNEEIVAQASAVIWKNQISLIKKKFPHNIFSILKAGNQIRLKVLVDFHPRYGLKLVIHDLDSSFTLGQIAQNRIQIISKLKEANLWQLNKNLKLPKVIQKIALISSPTAAGYIDFTDHLKSNPAGYSFKISLFQASMQGDNTEYEISNAFNKINNESFDIVAIIRGGGAKLDLLDFDSFLISKSISNCPYPVLTGIGHQIDESIADLNAFNACKTPTAVAEFIINHNAIFETQLIEILNEIKILSRRKISVENLRQENMRAKINNASQNKVWQSSSRLNEIFTKIIKTSKENIHSELIGLKNMEAILKINDPSSILSRGYTITLQGNRWVKKLSDLDTKSEYTTKFKDGQITSKT
ncbi:MAG TPA: exodeoxyribonuclease VII large subunit [Saprospiraceae bacterium]|nr:exodeoxyribonuclease VII large subunit [Saprospiraceae bacterium]